MHRIGCGFFFPSSSSGITEEVAALVFWLYNDTVLCFVVVVVVFFMRSRKLCLFSLLRNATDNFLRSVLVNFSYKIPVYLFKICQISANICHFWRWFCHSSVYVAHCLKLTKSIGVHLNLVLIVLFNGEISIIPSMSSLGLWPHFRARILPPPYPCKLSVNLI